MSTPSAPVAPPPAVAAFDADRPWHLHDRVALRPEPFGALAYHYGNRRLTFLRSPDLVALVEGLAGSPSARAAFDSCGLDARRWPSFEKALRSLAAGDFIVATGTDTGTAATTGTDAATPGTTADPDPGTPTADTDPEDRP